MKKLAVVLLLVLCASLVASAAEMNARMTNKDVLDMMSIGLGEDVIVAKIHSAKLTEFDTSIEALKTLKEAKVPDTVIKAMLNPALVATAAATPAEDPNLPPKEVGIYWRDKNTWVAIDGQMVGQAKIGGRWASMGTMGLKAKHWNAYIPGPTSKVKVKDARPEFYVYVAEGTSANDFQLLKLDKKGDKRQFEVGSIGGVVGGKSGLRDDNMIAFEATKVAPRTYKLVLNTDLKGGEYAFFQSLGQSYNSANGKETGGNTNGRVFDFSILD